MKQSIRAAREARGWTRNQLAEKAAVSVHLLARVERGEGGLTFAQLQNLAKALETSAHVLEFPQSRASGRPPRAARELVELFRQPGRYDPSYGMPAGTSLPAARKAYPRLMGELDQLMFTDWQRFLATAPSDSSLETLNYLLELRHGAQICQVSPQELGFDRFPVVERKSDPS